MIIDFKIARIPSCIIKLRLVPYVVRCSLISYNNLLASSPKMVFRIPIVVLDLKTITLKCLSKCLT